MKHCGGKTLESVGGNSFPVCMRATWAQDRPRIRELRKVLIKMADVDDRGSVGDEEGGKDLWY